MHRSYALLVPVIVIGLCGCPLRKTPVVKAAPPPVKPTVAPPPAPPPEPVSVPQTTVQLPPPQPVSQEAIATTQSPEEPAIPAAPVRTGARPQGPRTPSQTSPARNEPVSPPIATPPAAPPPERGPLQEVLPANELKRLQDEANGRKREARQLVDQARRRHLTRQQGGIVDRILTFIRQADDAERRGDMRQADELAERALVLARELKP